MKRLSVVCGLFHLVTWMSFSSLLTQHSAFGQSSGYGGPGGLAGGEGGFGDGPGGFSMPSPLTGRGEKGVAAIRDRCLVLSTKFNHNGVEFESKTGIGCIIATPQGQRILAMPLSMTQPIEVSQERANGKLTIPSSLLLAGKLGSDKKSRERLEAFAAQVADLPRTNEPNDFALESERKIYRALSERTELSFNGTPLAGVVKYFRQTFEIPILFDDSALEIEKLSTDEPITIELPAVTFRSALNLILDPLNLTYVIENEVLMITSKRTVRNGGIDFKVAERASENRIFGALNEQQEVRFNGTPLSHVVKFFREELQIPIVIDDRALEADRLSTDEPITLELPAVSFRSALNLILDPLKLTYVVDNEVLRITTKTAARSGEKETTPFVGASLRGTVAYSYFGGRPSGGMGGMEGGEGSSGFGGGGMGLNDSFEPATVHRYGTSQEAQHANRSVKSQSGDMSGSSDGGMGSGMGGVPGRKREYAAIQGPLAVQVNADLGVAFISLPGDFQSIAIPTRLEPTNKQFVMVENAVIALSDKVQLARNSIPEGAPVVDERGEPVGMYIAEKVVSFSQLFEALMRIDTKSLGYWGAESAKIKSQVVEVVESQVIEGMPELIPAELKSRIAKAASLQGKEKTKAMKELRFLLSTQVTDRNRFVERKIEILHGKLATLTRLTNEMKKKDSVEVNKFLPKELALEILENAEDDPFK